MCNAWNHPPGCNCGWGGDTDGGGHNASDSAKGLGIPSNAQTYQIKCMWCSEKVFDRTNGYGDSVLFDKLKYPWQIHECWKKYKQEQSDKFRAASIANSTQQKLIVLASYVQKFCFPPYEYSVAHEMSISVEQLRASYGDLYYLDDTYALKIREDKDVHLEQVRQQFNQRIEQSKQQKSKEKEAKQEIIEIKKHRKLEDKPRTKKRRINSGAFQNKVTLSPKITCPYCQVILDKQTMGKHLFEQHYRRSYKNI